MTTPQSFRLTRGNISLDLTSDPYSLGVGFTIPALVHSAYIARGSLANVTGGGTRTAIKYEDSTWTFDLRLDGSSDADVKLAAQRITNLLYSLSSTLPTYLEYRINTDTPEPLWGNYGSALHFEIVDTLDVHLWNTWADLETRGHAALLTISVEIKPSAAGAQQRLCTATGGIMEETVGSTDGSSNGLLVPEVGAGNLFTNPVFGNATWSTGWTSGANIITTQNTDARFMLFGYSSAKLVCNGAANSFYQTLTLTVATYTLSCYAIKPDKSAVTISDVSVDFNSSAQTPTITAVGNGWYRIVYSGTAAAAPGNYGVFIAVGAGLYFDGFQVELKAYATSLYHGDLMGCAWSGTAHASSSTRTVAECSLTIASDTFSLAQGTIRAIVRFDVPNTHPNHLHIFDTRDAGHASSLQGYFLATDDKFYFLDGTNTISSAAQTFAAVTVSILHFVYGPAGLAIYLNGTSIASGVTYTPPSTGTAIVIGSAYTPANNLVGVLKEFAVSDVALTAPQVANDAANLSAALTNGMRLGSVPAFWTLSGDNILSLDTGKNPLGVVIGVPGSMPALTEIQGVLSSTFTTIKSFVLSNYPCSTKLLLADFLKDESGTVDASSYGGQDWVNSVPGSGTAAVVSSMTIGKAHVSLFDGAEFYLFSRFKAASGDTVTLYSTYSLGGVSGTGDSRTIVMSTAMRLWRTKSQAIGVPSLTKLLYPSLVVQLWLNKAAAGAVNVNVDYTALLPRPVRVFSDTSGFKGFVYRGNITQLIDESSNNPIGNLSTVGDVIEFSPNTYNHLQAYFGSAENIDPLITYAVTLSPIFVTPRWALL